MVPFAREVPCVALRMAAVAGLLLALTVGALAQSRGLERDGVTVYYQARDEQFARVALDAAVAALPRLEGALQLTPKSPAARRAIRIDIARTQQEFDALAGEPMKPWVQGVALPGRHVVVQTLAPANMKVVVAHELTHVLLDEVADQLHAEPPRWLHEGLAKYSTEDFNENDREVLGKAIVERRLVDLHHLDDAFSGTRDQMALAYAESYTLVRYLHELQPGGGIALFLRNLALTNDVDRAVLRTYGEPADKLQAAWLMQVRQEYLKHGLDLASESLIFAFMALLFLGVYLISRHRRRLIREHLQEEERLRRMFGYTEDDTLTEPPDEEDLEPELYDEF